MKLFPTALTAANRFYGHGTSPWPSEVRKLSNQGATTRAAAPGTPARNRRCLNKHTTIPIIYSGLRDVTEKAELSAAAPDHIPGLLKLASLEIELSKILGRKVDLRTAQDLSTYFRDDVLKQAKVAYVEA